MTILTNNWWTLARDDRSCTLRQYSTRTRLTGDVARHIDCRLVEELAIPLEELAAAMLDRNITEFSTEESASWELTAPGCE